MGKLVTGVLLQGHAPLVWWTVSCVNTQQEYNSIPLAIRGV